MGSTSFGVEVRAATSRLVAMRRKIEDDAAALKIGKVRIRDQSPQSSDFGAPVPRRGRFGQTADFSSPTKIRDRPRSKNGATSFHFAVTKIKRPAGTTSGGRPLPGFAAKASPASDHARYVERADALEIGAFDRADDMVIDLRQPSQSLLPRVANDDSNAILTNISADADERHEFWLAVEHNERQARSHAIVLDPTKSPPWWAGIDAKAKLPASFRFHCIMERHRYLDWLEDTSKDKEKFRSKAYVADAEACGRALAAAQQIAGFNRKQPPLRLRAGRSGRVQMRIVAELPHELTSAQRGDLVRKYCEYLSSFARDDDGNSVGMMFTAAIHRPDAEGDSRNYHVHICCYDRPARWLFQENCWDFAYETQEREGSKSVTRYPLRQKKIIEVSRTLNAAKRAAHPHFNATIAGMNFIPHLRAKFAELCNVALQNAKAKRRVDPRTYLEMQIPLAAGFHLGSRAAALEAAGVPTARGTYNAKIEWADVERKIHLSAEHAKQQNLDRLREYSGMLDSARIVDDCAEKTLLTELASERRELISGVEDDRLELNLYAMQRAMLHSRAQLVVTRCTALLEKMQQGVKPASDWRLAAVTKRLKEAYDHLAKVERELERHSALISAAEVDVSARERRIAVIDEQCRPLLPKIWTMYVQTRKHLDALKIEHDAVFDRLEARKAAQAAANSVVHVHPIETATPALPAEPRPALAHGKLQPSLSTPEPNTHVPVKRKRSTLAIVAGLDFTISQPGSFSAGLVQRVPSLASLLGLSSMPVANDARWIAELLPAVQGSDIRLPQFRQDERHDHEVRRSPIGDSHGPERTAAGREPRLENPQNHSPSAAPIAKSPADPKKSALVPPPREPKPGPSTTSEAPPTAADTRA